jgi:hypothetical protein
MSTTNVVLVAGGHGVNGSSPRSVGAQLRILADGVNGRQCRAYPIGTHLISSEPQLTESIVEKFKD